MLFQFARGVIDQDRDLAIGAPSKTPAEIIVTLNKDINAGLADPKVKGQLTDLGATVLAGSSADTAILIAEETAKWRKVVKFSGAKSN
ncbi:MAG: tripartite tricarboxylate transporter substrate-binding protein [Hyphomicrobiales bacterium]